MSNLMTRGIIGMPYEMAMENELSRKQFYDRAQKLLADHELLKESALELCDTIENKEDLNITKWALKSSFLIGRIKRAIDK